MGTNNLLSGRVWTVGSLWVALACSGKTAGEEPDTPGAKGGATSAVGGAGVAGGAGVSAGTGGGNDLPALWEVCDPYCERIDSCQPNGPFPNCVQACEALDDVYAGGCLDKQIAELACVASLACSEVPTYVDDKQTHPACGAVYRDLARSCQYNDGSPPGACLSFCTSAYSCRPDIVLQPQGCAQNCNEVLTGYDAVGGAACSGAMLAMYACLGQLDCEEIETLLVTQVTPASCGVHDSNIAAACR